MTNIVSDLYGPDPPPMAEQFNHCFEKTGLTLVTDGTYKLMSQVMLKKLYVAYSI